LQPPLFRLWHKLRFDMLKFARIIRQKHANILSEHTINNRPNNPHFQPILRCQLIVFNKFLRPGLNVTQINPVNENPNHKHLLHVRREPPIAMQAKLDP
jgi:hypothetical protein